MDADVTLTLSIAKSTADELSRTWSKMAPLNERFPSGNEKPGGTLPIAELEPTMVPANMASSLNTSESKGVLSAKNGSLQEFVKVPFWRRF